MKRPTLTEALWQASNARHEDPAPPKSFLDHIPDALAMPLIMLVAALVGGLALSCGGGR